MRAPKALSPAGADGKLVIEIVAAFQQEDCLIAVSRKQLLLLLLQDGAWKKCSKNFAPIHSSQLPQLMPVLEWIAVAWTYSANMQGIAPFGEDIALLAYVLEEGSSLREAQAPGNGQAGDARRPEVRPYTSAPIYVVNKSGK